MTTPDELLSLAERLIQHGSEVEWRDAISRGYYATFHAGRQLLRDLGFLVPRAATAHAYVWMRLSNCGDPAIQVAGNDLNDLQSARNRADYELGLNLPQADCLLWVQSARSIIQALATGRVEPTRSQIQTAIRNYEQNVLGRVTWQGP